MAYTLLDLQTSIQDDLKDSSFSASRITRYLNAAQLVIFNTHVFKFCETAVTGALTVGEYTFDQQSNHQATIGGVLVDPETDTRRFILNEETFLSTRDFFERFPDPSTETDQLPAWWTEFGDQVYFNCPVDEAYLFTQRYYKVPTALASSADVPSVPSAFRELLELYSLFRAEKYRGNHDVAATYKQEFEDGLESMVLRYSTNQVAPHVMRQTRTRVE